MHAKFHLDPSNRLATVHERHRQDREDRQTGQTDRTHRQTRQTGQTDNGAIPEVSQLTTAENMPQYLATFSYKGFELSASEK